MTLILKRNLDIANVYYITTNEVSTLDVTARTDTQTETHTHKQTVVWP